jgi:hypothetical protein
MTTTATRTADLRELAADTAAHLGTGWTTAPAEWPHMQELTHSDGRVIRLSTYTYVSGPGRVHVSGQYPQPNSLRASACPAITVRADRGARVLASEITRRFLRPHAEAHAKAVEYAAQVQRDRHATDALNGQLAAILTGSRLLPRTERTDGDVRLEIPGAYRCSFRSDWHGLSATIELQRVPASVALAVAVAVTVSVEAYRRGVAAQN